MVLLEMGIWFCLESSSFKQTSLMFSEEGNFTNTSTNYFYQFHKMCFRHEEDLRNMMRYEHCNPHGIRKGSEIKDTSGTTLPP